MLLLEILAFVSSRITYLKIQIEEFGEDGKKEEKKDVVVSGAVTGITGRQTVSLFKDILSRCGHPTMLCQHGIPVNRKDSHAC